jgi:NAD-dependent DNA ligase adenylation domain
MCSGNTGHACRSRADSAIESCDAVPARATDDVDLQALRSASKRELLEIKGVGPNKAQLIRSLLDSVAGQPQHKDGTAKCSQPAPSSKQADLGLQLEMLQQQRASYYAGTSVVSDEVYDALLANFKAAVQLAEQRGDDVKSSKQFLASVGAPPPTQSALAPPGERKPRKPQHVDVSRGDRAAAIQPVRHTPERGGRLLSLAAVHSEAELRTWWQRNVTHVLGTGAASSSIVVEPKVDGLTLRLSYEGGKLVEVRTESSALASR